MTDVIDQVRPEFDQLGVEEAVLQELLRLWELRLAQSRAADFTQDERMAPVARQFPMLSHEEAAQQTQLLLKQEEEAKAVSSGLASIADPRGRRTTAAGQSQESEYTD
jgi:transcription initiation factor TFIIA large subunit